MIGKAVMKLREMSADEVEREIAFRRMIAIADEQGRLEYAHKEGRREAAARMKVDGMEIALIEKYTGLSREEISEL